MPEFREGDLVLLVDLKGRKYLFSLKKDSSFHFHKGQLNHNQILGRQEGIEVTSSLGERLFVFRPTLEEYVLKMKRGAQIIYPKDLSRIISLVDIFPGAKVFEAGTGSGALTLFLLRAVGKEGTVVSYERRKDFFETAKANIERYMGSEVLGNLILQNRDIGDGIDYDNFDRAILDLTEPWLYIEEVLRILRPGGILGIYVTTVLQIYNLIEKVEKDSKRGVFLEGIFELLEREWEKEGLSLRPALRMVAHTGFMIVLRKLQ